MTFENKTKIVLKRGTEYVVSAVCVIIITPNTVVDYPFRLLISAANTAISNISGRSVSMESLGYALGPVAFAITAMIMICFPLLDVDQKALGTRKVLYSVCCLATIYTCNIVLRPATIPECWWIPWVFSLFLWIVATRSSAIAYRLTFLCLALIVVQSIYGIVYYLNGTNQLYTPHFGKRTSGTFTNPNHFYPLMLLALPLILLTLRKTNNILYFLLLTGFLCCSSALILTFSRAGWLAASISLLLLPKINSSKRFVLRLAPYIFALTIVATMFVRTHGGLIGSHRDRSFWGRIEIWKVSIHALAASPALGSGPGSFAEVQQHYMTSNLLMYNPANLEAKNLYLTLAIELGFVGLASFLVATYQIIMLMRRFLLLPRNRANHRDFVVGVCAGAVAILVVGLVDTPVLYVDRIATTWAFFVLVASAVVIADEQLEEPPMIDEGEQNLNESAVKASGYEN